MTPDGVDGATIAVTGATSGIGRRAARELAEAGATVAAVGRDAERADALQRATADAPGEVRFHRADLAEQAAVRDLADELRSTYDALDVLALNAGVSTGSRRESPDGVELTFAVNHLAPYLLTHELVDLLEAGTPSRVVVTASEVHRDGDLDFEDLQFESGFDTMAAYGRSKLANVAFTAELAERLDGDAVTANCFHPGFVPGTSLFRNLALHQRLLLRAAAVVPLVGTTVETAADRLLEVATAPRFGERSGDYVVDGQPTEPAAPARDPETRQRLWEHSAALVDVDPEWP